MKELTVLVFLSILILPFVVSDDNGRVLQIISVVNGMFVPDMDNIRTVFDQISPQTEIGVVSIAGEYRKGKSFLLNFFLQYMQYREGHDAARTSTFSGLKNSVEQGTHAWLHDVEKNSGFQFRSGRLRDTVGITVWSKPFVFNRSDGRRVALLIMDSQGLYDASTNSNDNVRLFTMVSLLSSSLMLNTPQNINLKQLMELKYFMEYATTGSTIIDGQKPFQRLTFLIRDYTLSETLGWNGGKEELDQFMVPNAYQSDETKQLGRNLTKGFSEIDGFALPFPGRDVTKSDYDGSLSKIDLEFLIHLEELVINISEGAQPRKPLVVPLTAGSFAEHVTKVISIFNSQLPPDELMKMNERELVTKVFESIQQMIHLYEAKMQDIVETKPDEYYLERGRFELFGEIKRKNADTANDILRSFSETPLATFILNRTPDGRAVTAMQLLQEHLQERFEKMAPQLEKILSKRQEEAENRKKQETANAEAKAALKKREQELEEERRKLQGQIDDMNNRDSNDRGNSLWKKIGNFFGGLFGGLFGR